MSTHNGDTKPSRYKSTAEGRTRHVRGPGAPGTPNGPHKSPAKGDTEPCYCGRCGPERRRNAAV